MYQVVGDHVHEQLPADQVGALGAERVLGLRGFDVFDVEFDFPATDEVVTELHHGEGATELLHVQVILPPVLRCIGHRHSGSRQRAVHGVCDPFLLGAEDGRRAARLKFQQMPADFLELFRTADVVGFRALF